MSNDLPISVEKKETNTNSSENKKIISDNSPSVMKNILGTDEKQRNKFLIDWVNRPDFIGAVFFICITVVIWFFKQQWWKKYFLLFYSL